MSTLYFLLSRRDCSGSKLGLIQLMTDFDFDHIQVRDSCADEHAKLYHGAHAWSQGLTARIPWSPRACIESLKSAGWPCRAS